MGLTVLPQVLRPRRYTDHRGWFSETFHEQRLRDRGITCHFVQDNQSSSEKAGTLRGMHFQIPPAAQAKLISVVQGRIIDVVVDIRRGSPTFGKHVSTVLSAATGEQLYVPVGFAHGFLTLEDKTIVLYKTSSYYTPTCERGVLWDDPNLSIDWPVKKNEVILSDKDRSLPLLAEIDLLFEYDGQPLAPLARES
jgi:dTDP-4-dehydrorhamnose 3,5-epimerase